MKITLSQEEIQQATLQYVNTLISIPANKEAYLDFTTTRSPFSVQAEIEIREKASSEASLVKPEFPSAPVMEPEEEEISSQDEAEPVNNSVHSLFGNLN